jgi:hypothetical protein
MKGRYSGEIFYFDWMIHFGEMTHLDDFFAFAIVRAGLIPSYTGLKAQ